MGNRGEEKVNFRAIFSAKSKTIEREREKASNTFLVMYQISPEGAEAQNSQRKLTGRNLISFPPPFSFSSISQTYRIIREENGDCKNFLPQIIGRETRRNSYFYTI